jgi:hypothetical protein
MKNKIIFLTLCLFFVIISLSLAGCSFAPASKQFIYNSYLFQGRFSYKDALKKWTRKTDVYNRFHTVMLVRATFFNIPFKYAYSMEYAKYYMLNRKAFKKMLKKSYSKAAKYTKFFVSVYTPEKKYNDLDSNRSIWMIYLVNNKSQSVLPLEIKPSEQKKVFFKTFFPYITRWSRQYIIEFPKYYNKKKDELIISPHTKWIKLVIAGVNGKAELKWNFH